MTPHFVKFTLRNPTMLGILIQGQPVPLLILVALPVRFKLVTALPHKMSSPSLRSAPYKLPVAKIRMTLPATRTGIADDTPQR